MLKKTTVYIQADLYEALRLRASDINQSISGLVNQAVRNALEDTEDLAAIEERAHEPNLRFEDVLKKL
jgi:hypothetical protein